MPPDYELQSYWNDRFKDEYHFEWLDDGRETILPHLRAHLRSQSRANPPHPPRLLHIGAGTSSLSERIRELYRDVFGDNVNEQVIVNADFAETLVRRKSEAEVKRAAEGGGRGMRWMLADVLKWDESKQLLDGQQGLFDVVVDKSTSDSVSCCGDVSFAFSNRSFHPLLNLHLTPDPSPRDAITLSPVELLALHLASLVQPGGLWLALSFSSTRFCFLEKQKAGAPVDPALYWTIQEVDTVDAPTGLERSDVHAPAVKHYLYVIRRSDAPL
ncbi:hypothetical protein A0H81_11505 [Grifola frondosa]|uniref:Methyltransferase-like protein 13 n=1 Tax=Grifola frondosa TaxID=5627 RepID=A0A1C7LZV8_GRIFR|nr:hypothetical protein A0H81_11505 [Grifola frondosa]